jgi:hypothetical protein
MLPAIQPIGADVNSQADKWQRCVLLHDPDAPAAASGSLHGAFLQVVGEVEEGDGKDAAESNGLARHSQNRNRGPSRVGDFVSMIG